MTEVLKDIGLSLVPFVSVLAWLAIENWWVARRDAEPERPVVRVYVRSEYGTFEHDSQAIDVTRDSVPVVWVDGRTGRSFNIGDEAEAYLAAREPRRR